MKLSVFALLIIPTIIQPVVARNFSNMLTDAAINHDMAKIREARVKFDRSLATQGASHPWDGEDIGLVPVAPRRK